ncbi:GAF domain-containing protein [uncultured Nocardioides sp.]|uniref:GAF domain-containing protein n=1 Tax=uncultured Nocardioides sp. TaxID=198441 RepID=UPI0025E0D41C|nr:GAF domain-containing protein [uncultured Nocardioides sp.]
MEPIPETHEALAELADEELLVQLLEAARRVEEVVPDCVGLSLTMVQHGVTFTLVASDETIAVIDAIQYLAGGPCLNAVDDEAVLETDTRDDARMSEQGWQLFADASVANGIATTLSMPILDDGAVVGGVNLYGATRRAFEGHHEQLAEVLGAWAGGAVTNADLDFTTRIDAESAPAVLRGARQVDEALGALAEALQISVDEARDRLDRAAARAQLRPSELATAVTRLLRGQ